MERLENGCNKKLTDINFDCLVNCFRYLSVEDLLNVADSNEQLRRAGSYVFSRLCDRKTVFLHVLKSCWEKCHCKSKEREKILGVYHLKMGLQLLRCFGDLVSAVEVQFQNITEIRLMGNPFFRQKLEEAGYGMDYYEQCAKAYEYEHLIIHYINEYCSKSLTNIKFTGNTFGDLTKLTKEFVNVVKLNVNTAFPTEKKLIELFPKVRQLELYYHQYVPDNCDPDTFLHNDIAYHFPDLEELSINKRGWQLNNNAAIALRLNPQLKTLRGDVWLNVIFNTDEFLDSNEHLQNLETLDLVVNRNTVTEKITGKNIHLRNLKELCFSNETGAEPCAIPFSSDKLESLIIFTDYILDVHKIIEKYPTLKKLDISASFADEFDFSKISKTLPLLEEIHVFCIDQWVITFDTVVFVINSLPFLRLFKFFTGNPFETDKAHLLNGWSVSSENLFRYDETVIKRQN